MTDAFDDLLAANAEFAAAFVDDELPGRAAQALAVVTCMDSRMEPLRMLGLARGDAKILRTAGARVTDDVLRSLVLAHHLLGVERVMVVAHTDCGMVRVTDDDVHHTIRQRAGVDTRSLDFHTIEDQGAALERDVQRIRSLHYLPDAMPVIGVLYDVHTGRLSVEVP